MKPLSSTPSAVETLPVPENHPTDQERAQREFEEERKHAREQMELQSKILEETRRMEEEMLEVIRQAEEDRRLAA